MQHLESNNLPFALRGHEKAVVEGTTLLGDPEQEWTWSPLGDLKPEDLRIYASGGTSTSRQTYSGTWDHGELY